MIFHLSVYICSIWFVDMKSEKIQRSHPYTTSTLLFILYLTYLVIVLHKKEEDNLYLKEILKDKKKVRIVVMNCFSHFFNPKHQTFQLYSALFVFLTVNHTKEDI